MTQNEKQKLIKLIGDLLWDYDRMSSSGQKTINELSEFLGIQ